ncbi:NAD(P)-binding protein [Aspergillus terreus]|uniref:NAD(P)-binding protein n=1 Tax=Aspergillus terreus TaxID=33178 RepID=A0A5M3YU58_ASPTE|nr:hypothetical protein ATETN484_0003075400 [Aspergillus terreus]GFF14740.1 NAD(P)-binding protein [Aspergillus terreus]
MPSKIQTVGVIGPAGFGGSHLCLELIQRGHRVVGISRHPERLGEHPSYTPRAVDLDTVTTAGLAEAFNGLDAVVSEYAPHTPGPGPLQYMTFLEVVRKIVLAVQWAQVPYFVFVGGGGSLHVPGTAPPECLVDDPDFFVAYRRALADSEAHVRYMEERLGPLVASLRTYREARCAVRAGAATTEQKAFVDSFEQSRRDGNDEARDFIRAARTAYMFFTGNTSFSWSFVSPSPMYRPGKRTGQYQASIDEVPLLEVTGADSGNRFDGRLPGISVADLAIAIADEVEARRYVHRHWTAVGDLDDTPSPSYVRL